MRNSFTTLIAADIYANDTSIDARNRGGFETNDVVPRTRNIEYPNRLSAGTEASLLPLWVLIALAVAYVLPGMAGYGPWKPDEPYIFGIVHSLMQSGDWVVPTLAGETFMEKPPLYMWMGALTATLASPWLSPEYGARLAIGAFMLVTLVSIGLAARRWWGGGHGRMAVMVLLGSLGLAQHGHMMIPDLPLLAGFAVALLGFAWIGERPLKGGLLLGTGIGMTFMAKGVLGPGVLGTTAVMLPIVFRAWRTPAYRRGLLFALLASAPWLLIWPTALYLRSPALFSEWFWMNNVGRFLGFSVPVLGAAHEPGHMQSTLPWFTFPALPLAAWVVWKKRNNLFNCAACQVSFVMFTVMFAVLSVSASARVVYLLPLLAPLAIIAAPAAALIPSRLDLIGDWFARIVFGALVALVWIVAIWFAVNGQPPQWPLLSKHLPMDFLLEIRPLAVVTAVALLAAWWVLLARLSAFKGRSLVSWTSGLTVVWGTLFALLLPWIDAAKSYQATFREMQEILPLSSNCVSSKGLGESERGMLHYVTGIASKRLEIIADPGCALLLQEGNVDKPPQYTAEEGWRLLWDGSRPGEQREHFWLYVRSDLIAAKVPPIAPVLAVKNPT